MTKQEAIQEMKNGKKVTHIFFALSEYIKLDQDGNIETEDGYSIAPYLFWLNRKGDYWEKDWEIFNPIFSNK